VEPVEAAVPDLSDVLESFDFNQLVLLAWRILLASMIIGPVITERRLCRSLPPQLRWRDCEAARYRSDVHGHQPKRGGAAGRSLRAGLFGPSSQMRLVISVISLLPSGDRA